MNVNKLITGSLATVALGVFALAAPVQASTVNIRDFGGVGDGKADDTEAFRKAFNALKRTDATKLEIPVGTYRITKTLKMDLVGRVIIEGEGRDTVLDRKSTRLNSSHYS